MNISIRFVTINYRSTDSTTRLVAQLAGFERVYDIKTVVYDNSGEYQKGQNEEVISLGKNVGIGPIWEKEILEVDDETFLIICNNDIIIDKNFFERLAQNSNLKDKVIGPLILNDGSVWSAGGSLSNLLPWRIKHSSKILSNEFYSTGHVSGCCIVVCRISESKRKKIAASLGAYFFRGEEWQLNLNCDKALVERAIDPSMILEHSENGSHDRFSLQHIYFALRAKFLFIDLNCNVFQRLSYIIHLATFGISFYHKNSKCSYRDVVGVSLKAFFDDLSYSEVDEDHWDDS